MSQALRVMRVSTSRLVPLAAASLALALMLAATSVHADSKTGTTGVYTIKDTSGSPGANCNYAPQPSTHYLVSFSVRGPSVKWPSSSTAASGKVGWWAVVQKAGNSGWVTVKTGAVKTATATKTAATSFAKQTVKYAAQVDAPFRVVDHVAWYAPDNHVIGRATHVVAHCRESYVGWSQPSKGSCPGHEVQLGGV
jgi:hypothetical protein